VNISEKQGSWLDLCLKRGTFIQFLDVF
jgi:hypothetical protein